MEAPRERKPVERWRYVLWIAVGAVALYMIIDGLIQVIRNG